MEAAIEIRALAKRYRLGADAASYDTLREALTRVLRRGAAADEIWALRGLDLDVGQGEALGIIGPNGAGKTTLLKILAGITYPTRGEARVRGRVGALLDVGTGFHPELTGRENVYLSGAIHGMPRNELRRRFDDIVEFAGVARFLDTPVKRYSSGMRLRLGFSVAAHIQSPILVVDEVLAVGDAAFRERCLGKISEIGQDARTVLFVSHDLGALQRVCARSVWLEAGSRRLDGTTRDVVAAYLRAGETPRLHTVLEDAGAGPVRLREVSVRDVAGRTLTAPKRTEPLAVEVRFAVHEPYPGLDLAVALVDEDGSRVIDDARSDWVYDGGLAGRLGSYVATATIPAILKPGRYVLMVWIGTEHETLIDRELLVIPVSPREGDSRMTIERRRVTQPRLDWTVEFEPAP